MGAAHSTLALRRAAPCIAAVPLAFQASYRLSCETVPPAQAQGLRTARKGAACASKAARA